MSTRENQGASERGTPPAADPPRFVGILFVGMNPDAPTEGKLLRELNRDRGSARLITDSAVPDTITLGATTYNLASEDGRAGFVETLHLPTPLGPRAVELLSHQYDDARDEAAQIIQAYAEAERGEREIERVVISGHSGGSSVWGDDNGVLLFDFFETLAELFPRAARQVRDLMLSACYTGGESQVARYRRMFPEVETIWSYAGSSPGTWTGSQDHIRLWEKATEGKTPALLDPGLAAGTRKGDNVATWTGEEGYISRYGLSLERAEQVVRDGESTFQLHFDGDLEVPNSQSGPLRDHYNSVQQLLAHQDLHPDKRQLFENRRDVALRLLFFPLVRSRFVGAYGSDLEAGYVQIGSTLPAYQNLSRRETLDAVTAFGSRSAGAGDVARRAHDLLKRGLHHLSPDLIPITWI